MQYLVTERMVEMVFAPVEEVAAWFGRIGLEAQRQDEGVVMLINPYLNFRTAILENSDPVTRAVALASAIAGAFWPQVFPHLLAEVNKEWRVRAKEVRLGTQKAAPPKGAGGKARRGKKSKQRRDGRTGSGRPTFEQQFKSSARRGGSRALPAPGRIGSRQVTRLKGD